MNKKHDIVKFELTERAKAVDGKYIVCKKNLCGQLFIDRLACRLGGFDQLAELDLGTAKAKKLLKEFGGSVLTTKFFARLFIDVCRRQPDAPGVCAFYRGADGRSEIRTFMSYVRDDGSFLIDALTDAELDERSDRRFEAEEYCLINNVGYREYREVLGLDEETFWMNYGV